MSDLIDRQAAIDKAKDLLIERDEYHNYCAELMKLPSVQPENEFLDFLWNVINPNDMEKYLSMYHSKEEKRNG